MLLHPCPQLHLPSSNVNANPATTAVAAAAWAGERPAMNENDADGRKLASISSNRRSSQITSRCSGVWQSRLASSACRSQRRASCRAASPRNASSEAACRAASPRTASSEAARQATFRWQCRSRPSCSISASASTTESTPLFAAPLPPLAALAAAMPSKSRLKRRRLRSLSATSSPSAAHALQEHSKRYLSQRAFRLSSFVRNKSV
mmetsp:Transcript_86578/g.279494  ORF Transcript_86578/g.279494 Transcript_86578/m.279494 type:complete len:206 (-) Transcript_86578:723-1340(-)